MKGGFGASIFVLAAVATIGVADFAAAACTPISTPAGVNNIRKNLAGDYCLTKDIDLASLGNFVPIGVSTNDPPKRFFTGTLDGAGHALLNLKIDDPGTDVTGLFRVIQGGTVKNLRFVNASVKHAKSNTGIVTGILSGFGTDPSSMLNVSAAGKVESYDGSSGGLVGACGGAITNSSFQGSVSARDAEVGGLAGITLSACVISRSWSSGSVTGGGYFAYLGGLVGEISSGLVQSSFSRSAVTASGTSSSDIMFVGGLTGQVLIGNLTGSFALGPVTATSEANSTYVGGLVGYNSKTISQCFAAGPVKGSRIGATGGLVGFSYGAIADCYATGPVAGTSGATAGLLGSLGRNGTILRSFATGRVTAVNGAQGGLVALIFNQGPVTNSYWDKGTTGQGGSAVGTGLTTAQLKAALPAGFTASRWGITKTVSYPYLISTAAFRSTLATTVNANRIFAFLPIGQLNSSEYAHAAPHANRASEAAVYTMLARAIGITKNVAALKAIKIDTTYWHDSTQTTTFNGTLTSHATRGAVIALAAATPISAANILGHLKANKVVLISGPSAVGTHSMLATSYQTDSAGTVIGLIANDPYTGKQVRIHPTTKKVVSPTGFPLTTFKVTSFRVITLL